MQIALLSGGKHNNLIDKVIRSARVVKCIHANASTHTRTDLCGAGRETRARAAHCDTLAYFKH